ncbi:MAG: hypothetical protein K2P87_06395 [Lachnospiraceae bacterium]|nr:hypothetical protein [Lachnospiraceae bacterium]
MKMLEKGSLHLYTTFWIYDTMFKNPKGGFYMRYFTVNVRKTATECGFMPHYSLRYHQMIGWLIELSGL